ncbi:MAG: hypothetical protein GJ680_11120 [Alteromonadaceae bacterium]|nr:hypothetical protein [Alteromonadaceae bacterium]
MNDIEELQMKLAYQEDTIEKLNAALVKQQRQIQDLEFKLGHIMDKVKQMSVSNMASEAEETPPPHY